MSHRTEIIGLQSGMTCMKIRGTKRTRTQQPKKQIILPPTPAGQPQQVVIQLKQAERILAQDPSRSVYENPRLSQEEKDMVTEIIYRNETHKINQL